MNVRDMWKARLEGRPVQPRRDGWADRAPAAGRAPFLGCILGIDPSLRGTGLALVEFAAGRTPLLLACRTVHVPAGRPMAFALAEIHRAVTAILAGAGVRHVALEQTIYVQNIRTAQILGAARGAAIGARPPPSAVCGCLGPGRCASSRRSPGWGGRARSRWRARCRRTWATAARLR